MRHIVLLCWLILLMTLPVAAQFSNSGRDFMFCYPANDFREAHTGTSENGLLIVTSSYATTGTVRNWDGSWSMGFSIPANGTSTVSIPTTFWLTTSEVVENKGLYVNADQDISAYFLSFEVSGATNDMSLLFPEGALGSEYITVGEQDNAGDVGNSIGNGNAFYGLGPSMLAIVATVDGTTLTITPTRPTEGGHAAGVPFTVTLNRFQTYQVLATTPTGVTAPNNYDLTGTHISATQPVAVYSGSTISYVPGKPVQAADYLLEQMTPLSAWGTQFLLIPYHQRGSWIGDQMRLVASQDGTVITIRKGGSTWTVNLNAHQFFTWDGGTITCPGFLGLCFGAYTGSSEFMDAPTYVSSNNPIIVGQYLLSAGFVDYNYGSPIGDPAYAIVPPVEQYSRRYIFLIPPTYDNDWINIVIANGHQGSLQIDGSPVGGTWQAMPILPYVGAPISVADGGHIIQADTTFMLIMYGYNNYYASYATVAGQNLELINAQYQINKYCLVDSICPGQETTWRIVLTQERGDPSTGVTILDTLPADFTFARNTTIRQTGSCVRTSIVNPNPGDPTMFWSGWSMRAGDSLIIEFVATAGMSVPPGRYDNAVLVYNSTGQTANNHSGLFGPEEDVYVLSSTPVTATGATSCEGTPGLLSVNSPRAGVTYTWYPGGYVGPNYSVTTPGDYWVEANDPAGCGNTYDTVQFVTNPTPLVTTIGDTVCDGQPGTLTSSTSAPAPLTYLWNPGGYTTQDITVMIPGNYMVTVTDGNGCVSAPTPATLTVSSGLAADAGPDVSACPGTTVGLGNSSGATGGIPSYLYSWNPVTDLDNSASPNPNLLVTGDATYVLTVTDGIGCQDIDTVQVTLDPPPVMGSLVSPPDASSQPPGTVQLNWNAATGTAPLTYDVYLDGSMQASGLIDLRYQVTVGCDEDHTWFVVVQSPCGPDTSETWSFTTPNCNGPVASIVTPAESSITACVPHQIRILIRDDNGVDWSTVTIEVQGTIYPSGSPAWTHNGDTLIFTQDPWWASGTTVHVVLVQARDISGNPMENALAWGFFVDYIHPVVTNADPTEGATVATRAPTLTFDLTDDFSGVRPESISVWIHSPSDSLRASLPHAGLSFTPPTFTVDCGAAGLTFNGGETVEICVHAVDRADTCGPNRLDTCWTFVVAAGGPVPVLITPFIGAISACADQELVLTLHDTDGVNPSTIRLTVDGLSYSIGANLSYDPVTDTLRFTPPTPWANGHRVEWCLDAASDWLNNPMGAPYCGWYLIDLLPPALLTSAPPNGTLTNDPGTHLRAELLDSISGVDSFSIVFWVPPDTIRPGWTSVPEPGGLMRYVVDYDPIAAGRPWRDNDTVFWCVVAHDSPDLCSPNELIRCREFYVHLSGPVQVPIMPWDSAITACSMQNIDILLTDPIGVDLTTIQLSVAGTIYTADSTQITHRGDTLRFSPWPGFVDGQVVVVNLLAAGDQLGNPLSNPIRWVFTVDLTPPFIVTQTPACDDVVDNTQPDITITLNDLISGVNDDSVRISVDGTWYDGTDAGFHYDVTTNTIHWLASEAGVTFPGGSVVRVCVYTVDSPDLCAPNPANPCCNINIASGGPVAHEIRPTDGIWSACDTQAVTINITDANGVDRNTIRILVNGDRHQPGDGRTVWADPVLTYTPLPPFGDGEVVTVVIDSASDMLGNPLSNPHFWTFRMDLAAPAWSNWAPPAAAVYPSTRPTVCFDVADVSTGINTDSLRILIDGISYSITDPAVNWNPATGRICWDAVLAGRTFPGGDTVRVGVHGIDRPTATYCGPNVLDAEYTFTIETGGPTGTEIRPTDSIYSACDTQAVTLDITDPDGIIASSIVIRVNGIRHIVGDGRTSWSAPRLTYDPAVDFPDGGWVTVCVDSVTDSLFNPLENPHCYSFQMDVSPPVISGQTPAGGDVFTGTSPVITWNLVDAITGLNGSTVAITINSGPPYRLGDLPVNYNAATGDWSFSCPDAGLSFIGGDTVRICVTADDQPTAGYCGPNELISCWTFSIVEGGPEGRIIFPRDTTWVACPDTVIRMRITGVNGVDSTTIRLSVAAHPGPDSSVYSVDGSRLFFQRDTLRYLPVPRWSDGDTVYVALLAADDTVGNALTAVVRWHFWVDLSAPTATNFLPAPWTAVPRVDPTVSFDLWDSLSGLNGAASTVTVTASNGYTQVFPLLGMHWNAATQHWSLDMGPLGAGLVGGDTVRVCIHAVDNPDYCVANVRDTCWSFTVARGGPQAVITRPMPWDISACPAESVIIRLEDPDGVNASTIRLSITIGDLGTPVEYTVGANLHYTSPWLSFQPTPPFANNDTVRVQLTAAEDALGNTLETPLDWQFVMDLASPAVVSHNPADMDSIPLWSLRPDIQLVLTDNILGVDSSTITMRIDGVYELPGLVTALTAGTSTWDSATGTFTFHPDLVSHINGDPQLTDGAWYPELVPITVTLSGVRDNTPNLCTSNQMADHQWTFIVLDDDTLPPDFVHAGPDHATWNVPFSLGWDITDAQSNIYDASVYLTWSTVLADVDNPADSATLNRVGVTDRFETVALTPPVDFAGWLYVRVHAQDNDFDFLRAADRTEGTYLDSVLIESGPVSERILPPQDAVTSCPLQVIKLVIRSVRPVDPPTIRLEVDGMAYSLGANLGWDGDSILTFTPSVLFVHGATVQVRLTEVADDHGNPMVFGDAWSFIVDLMPPVPIMREPSGVQEQPDCQVMVNQTDPSIRIEINDVPAGVDPATIGLTVNGVLRDVGSRGMSWASPYLIYSPRDAQAEFAEGETVHVSLTVADAPIQGPDYCPPNDTTAVWCFYVEPKITCAVRPDPFSPNADGKNDFDVFNYPHMMARKATIAIFTVRNVEVWRSADIGPFNSATEVQGRKWDGTDNSGKLVAPGVYLYVIEVESQVVCQGTVTVAK